MGSQEEDITIDETPYINMEDVANYNPIFPPSAADFKIRRKPVPAPARPRPAPVAVAPPPPPPSSWVPPENWDVQPRRPLQMARPPRHIPIVGPAGPPPGPPPPSGAPWVPPASWDVQPRRPQGHRPPPPAPIRLPPTPPTPSPSPPPPAPSMPAPLPLPQASTSAPLRPSTPVRTASGAVSTLARETAALHALNRFASNRDAADASDAAASALSDAAVASASDPAAAEEERDEASRAFHRGLALAMLEGRPIADENGEPISGANAVAIANGEPEQADQTFAEWSREHRWRMPEQWGGGGNRESFVYFDHEHEVAAEPGCFSWGCWFCWCSKGCCGGGGRAARNRRAWTAGNLN
ncbi:hypothetical protein VE03_03421 [Pseudogymnoascus sp. 23342-1-I1]|nr:hypothetical protein VE03_03421 [Pseudogymnoascus sp. 23342-1-I1]